MHFHIITMFPEFFTSPLKTGIMGKTIEAGEIHVSFYHIVDFKEAPNKRIDDTPFGGGAGMLFRPEPVARAIEHVLEVVRKKNPSATPRIIHFTPRGKRFTQAQAEALAKVQEQDVVLLCGRYEGIDQRVLDLFVTHEYCVGDAIITGGEYPALFLIDAVTRLLPGVLGNEESPHEESFSKNFGRKKEYPHYTRPEEWRGKKVPEVLLSGHHKKIKIWRKNNLL